MLISRKRQQVFTVAEIEWNEIRAPRLVIGFNQPGLICIKKQNLHGMSMAGLPYFFFLFRSSSIFLFVFVTPSCGTRGMVIN